MTNSRQITQLTHWLQIAFGVPAGLALLSKLDERLDFGPILERVVLKFNVVSEYAWSAIGSFIDRDLSAYHGLLSFFALSFGLILRSIIFPSKLKINKKDRIYWIEMFSLTFIFVLFVSNFEFNSMQSFISTIIIYFIIVVIFSRQGDFRNAPPLQALAILLAFTVVVSILLYIFGDGMRIKYILGYYIGTFLILCSKMLGPENLVFTKIGVFAFGIFMLDFSSRVVIPGLNNFLERIGA